MFVSSGSTKRERSTSTKMCPLEVMEAMKVVVKVVLVVVVIVVP